MPVVVGLLVLFLIMGLIGNGNPELGLERVFTGAAIALGLGAAYYGWKKVQQAENAQRAERERFYAQQQQYSAELAKLCETSVSSFEKMPLHLVDAETLLDQAESDFTDGVFAPFWDAVEQATRQIGQFDANVGAIKSNSMRYAALLPVYKSSPPRFPIRTESVRAMTAANATNARLKSIVRRAQSNFQFATIYEQRKTNQILITGFTNLGQALDGLGMRISSSIDGLRDEISSMADTLDESLTELRGQSRYASELNEKIETLHSTIQRGSADQTERHDHALTMLENIQRRRIPYPRKFGDGAYGR